MTYLTGAGTSALATLAGASLAMGRCPHQTSDAALLPAICFAVPSVSTSFLDMLMGSQLRQTASLVANVSFEHPARVALSITASRLSLCIQFHGLCRYASTLLCDTGILGGLVSDEQRRQSPADDRQAASERRGELD